MLVADWLKETVMLKEKETVFRFRATTEIPVRAHN